MIKQEGPFFRSGVRAGRVNDQRPLVRARELRRARGWAGRCAGRTHDVREGRANRATCARAGRVGERKDEGSAANGIAVRKG
jgi:adenine-specific DNA methylase